MCHTREVPGVERGCGFSGLPGIGPAESAHCPGAGCPLALSSLGAFTSAHLFAHSFLQEHFRSFHCVCSCAKAGCIAVSKTDQVRLSWCLRGWSAWEETGGK